jgi:hypothetical protein
MQKNTMLLSKILSVVANAEMGGLIRPTPKKFKNIFQN